MARNEFRETSNVNDLVGANAEEATLTFPKSSHQYHHSAGGIEEDGNQLPNRGRNLNILVLP
jgi:hypothetical protein